MARREAASSDTNSTGRKRKSASERLKPVLAESAEAPVADATEGDPLTLDARPYEPRAARAGKAASTGRTGRIAAAVVVTAAVGGAVAVGVVNAMHAQVHHLPTASDTAIAAAKQAAAVAANPAMATAEAHPFTEYQPPDREQVATAFQKVGAVYRSEGLSGVVRQSMDCFAGLKSAPSYATLDFCIAADAYGEALQHKLTDGQPVQGSYFTDAASRELTAARAVIGADGDAGARVLDIHRIAGEVSQGGPSAAHVQVAANTVAPPPVPPVAHEEAAPVAAHNAPAVMPVEAPPPPKALGTALNKPLHVASATAPTHPAPHAATAHSTAPHTAPAHHAAEPAPTVRVTHKTAPHVVILSPKLMKVHAEPAPRHNTHPRLQQASAPVHAAPPKLVKAHAHIDPVHEHPHLTRVAEREIAREKVRHARERFEEKHFAREEDRREDRPAPHKAQHQQFASLSHARSHHFAERDDDAPPPWQGAIRAIRASITGRTEGASRRSAEPAAWVDCRSPRSASEARMCDGGAAGDGTLGGQLRGRNR